MEKQLRGLIKEAMIAKNKNKNIETENRYQTLKNILETAQKSAKDKRIETITDSMIIEAAKKEIKQLNDTLEFCKNNEEKTVELMICINTAKELLPKMATEAEITTFVENHKAEAGNIGTMMKLLKEHFGDALDGKCASQIVKNTL